MIEPEKNKLIYYFKKWTSISEEDENIITSAFEPFFIKKKKDILRYGEVCKHIDFIVKGCLRSYYVDENGGNAIFVKADT